MLAIFGVVLIHSCGEVFYSYGKIPVGYWLSANLLDSLVRAAVPLFVMLSGSLLLKSADSLSVSRIGIGRRISKVLVPLMAWSIFYSWWVAYNTPDRIMNPTDWLQKLLNQPVMYHLWFVYMIIGLYILLPVFQVIFKACEDNANFKWYFLTIWLITSSLTIYIPMPFLVPMQITTIFGYGGYFILGGLLSSTRWINLGVLRSTICYLTGGLATFLISWMRASNSGVPDELAYSYFSPNVLLASVGAFILIQKTPTPNASVTRIINWMSDASFFVYFIHVLVLEFLRYGTFGVQISTSNIHPGFSIPLLAIATFVLSLTIAGLVRLIPGSRRIFG